jgi:hypothetical protein
MAVIEKSQNGFFFILIFEVLLSKCKKDWKMTESMIDPEKNIADQLVAGFLT